MPYKVSGKSVIRADTGKVVGHSKNPRKYLHVLQAVEHGWNPDRAKQAAKVTNRRIRYKIKH